MTGLTTLRAAHNTTVDRIRELRIQIDTAPLLERGWIAKTIDELETEAHRQLLAYANAYGQLKGWSSEETNRYVALVLGDPRQPRTPADIARHSARKG